MKEFTRPIRRSVKIRSADPALGNADFVITMDALGVSIRREGARKETAKRLSWRSVVSTALLFVKKE